MNRFFAGAVALASVLAVAACGNQQVPTVRVNLAQAQALARQVDVDLNTSIAPAIAKLTPDQQAKAMKAEAGLDAAVAAFVGAPSGNLTYPQLANAVLSALQEVVDAVPTLPENARLIADTAIPVLEAFITGLPMPVPAPAPAV